MHCHAFVWERECRSRPATRPAAQEADAAICPLQPCCSNNLLIYDQTYCSTREEQVWFGIIFLPGIFQGLGCESCQQACTLHVQGVTAISVIFITVQNIDNILDHQALLHTNSRLAKCRVRSPTLTDRGPNSAKD